MLAQRSFLGLDTPKRRYVFWSYLGLWCLLRLVIYGSQHSKTAPQYSPPALLVLSCLVKLGAAVWMTAAEEYDPCAPGCSGCRSVVQKTRESSDMCLRYVLPAFLYAVYDNLLFWNLSHLDPVTYGVLMQIRLFVTGFVWQVVFGRRLAPLQWAGILLITVACVLQKLHGAGGKVQPLSVSSEDHRGPGFYGLAGIFLQVGCGVFSSVYNEKMLKKGDISLNLQNVYMYSHSVLSNLVLLAATGQLPVVFEALRHSTYSGVHTFWVVSVAGLMGAIGIVTSLFLKHLDSVTKTIASAVELFFDAALAWCLFGIPVNAATLGALTLCSMGIMLYSTPPRSSAEAGGKDDPNGHNQV
eukprot:Hpha_TRINITY_DN19875_c0_g1::TRINITY_DN19875_c0_g1_i1::g.132052::m.132052